LEDPLAMPRPFCRQQHRTEVFRSPLNCSGCCHPLHRRFLSASSMSAWRKRHRHRFPSRHLSSIGSALIRFLAPRPGARCPAGLRSPAPRFLAARSTSRSRSIWVQRPRVTGSIGVRLAAFQWVRPRICSMVDLVVPTRREIWASLSSGWLRTSQRMALGRS
jgi:hypothetical protein